LGSWLLDWEGEQELERLGVEKLEVELVKKWSQAGSLESELAERLIEKFEEPKLVEEPSWPGDYCKMGTRTRLERWR
jgi:hypothetical protein